MSRRWLIVAGCVVLCGCGGSSSPSGGDRAAEPPAPSLVTPDQKEGTAARAAVPARLTPVPSSGTVRLQAGPFTDRVRVSALRLRPAAKPEVTGRMRNLTDVSEVLSLTVQADFYDRGGRHLGTGRQVFGETEEFHEHALRFRVQASRRVPEAAVAVLTIPDLVNE